MKTEHIEIVKSPWLTRFEELISDTKSSFTFTSPYVKTPVIKTIKSNLAHGLCISGLVSFRLRNFERGASDLNAIRVLHDIGANVRNIPSLHSKIYIFDRTTAVVTSANLTPGGLARNIELGLLVRKSDLVKQLDEYIQDLLNDDQKSLGITDEIIEESERILNHLPTPPSRPDIDLLEMEKELFGSEDNLDDFVFQGGIDTILDGLTGWNKDVFKCLLDIADNTFRLEQVYAFEDVLSKLYPENRNIKAKIRQQLQFLRDMGLLEFTPRRGIYRKLWQ